MGWTVRTKNAAAYANIEAVRTEIAEFAVPSSIASLPFFEDDDRHRCWRLEEIDHMPAKAQAAMRVIMEEAAATGDLTFLMTANDLQNLIRQSYRDAPCLISVTPIRKTARRSRMPSRKGWHRLSTKKVMNQNCDVIKKIVKKFGLDLRGALNELEKRLHDKS